MQGSGACVPEQDETAIQHWNHRESNPGARGWQLITPSLRQAHGLSCDALRLRFAVLRYAENPVSSQPTPRRLLATSYNQCH